MAEYIDREEAIDLFYQVDPEDDDLDGCTELWKQHNYSSDEIETMLSDLPAADVTAMRKGKWVDMEEDDSTEGMWRCSVCGDDRYFPEGHPKEYEMNYCPRCGAKMDLEGGDSNDA